jgi:hypothetical protein
MNSFFDKILEFVPAVIVAFGGTGILTFWDRQRQRNQLTESALFQEFKKEFKKELEQEKQENKKERKILSDKIDYLEGAVDSANKKILGLEFDMLAIKQTFADIPDAEARLEKASKMATYLKNQVGSLEISPTTNTKTVIKTESAKYIFFTILTVCISLLIFFYILHLGISNEDEIKKLELQNLSQLNTQ